MASKEPKIKFTGIVVNGQKQYDRPELHKARMQELEGKKFYEIFEEEEKRTSNDLRGYYFGGIISATLMKTEFFAGYTKEEIHQELMRTLRSYMKEVHGEMKEFTDNFSAYTQKEAAKYIEDLLNFLAFHDIHVLSTDEYKLNKFSSIL